MNRLLISILLALSLMGCDDTPPSTIGTDTESAEHHVDDNDHGDEPHRDGEGASTTIAAVTAERSGIAISVAGPGVIEERLALYGALVPDATRVRAIKARFPGTVRSVARQVGDPVHVGQMLATVESNDSLQVYAITAPIAGIVTQRDAEPGEQTDSEPLFEIVDYTSVWAEFSVFARDRAQLRVGQSVIVVAEGGHSARGPITYLSQLSSRDTQSATARVVLDNADGRWSPGQFVEGRALIAQTDVALAVPLAAVQRLGDADVVFVRLGDTYEAHPLQLGRRDAERVEVLSGLTAGTEYVSANSYLIKADIEKSGARHDH